MPQRTRQRSLLTVLQRRAFHYVRSGGGINNGQTGDADDPVEYDSDYFFEIIKDVNHHRVGPYGKFPVGPVGHAVWRFIPSGMPFILTYASSPGYANTTAYFLPGCMPVPAYSQVYAAIEPSSSMTNLLSDLSRQALTSFSTQVPRSSVSIANFFWELQEWESLIPKLASSLSKTLAGGVLNLEFGIKPFLSDITALSQLSSTILSRIHYLRKNNKKTRKVNFFVSNISELSDVIDYEYFDFTYSRGAPGAGDENWRAIPRGYRAYYHASGNLYQDLIGLDTVEGEVRAFMIALGLDNPLKIVWQGLPFSFIADWFLKIGKILDSLSVQPYEGVWSLTDVTCSVRTSMQWDVMSHFTRPDLNIPYLAGQIKYEGYTRFVGLPIINSNIEVDNLTPDELMLLVSLIEANL